MRAALTIAAKDLRTRLRDRSALVVAIVAPFGLAAILGLLIPGDDGSLDLTYAYADLDRTPVSATFADGPLAAIVEAGIAEVIEVGSEAEARQAVDRGDANAAIVMPSGFGAAVQGGGASDVLVIGRPDGGTSAGVAQAIVRGYAAELEAVRLAVATVLEGSGPHDPAAVAALAERAAATADPARVSAAAAEVRQVGGTTYYAAAMAIFFLFFTAQFGVLSLLSERRKGTLPRLVAAPIRPWSIVAGKALGGFLLGVVAMAVLVVASTVLLGARWGDPLAVALLVLAAVIAAMGITAAITTLARTEEQAGGWNAIVAVTLAILGGAFFPVSQGPEILASLSLVTPHAWFMRGLDQLSVASTGIADIGPSLAALLAFGLVTGAVGLLRAGRLVTDR